MNKMHGPHLLRDYYCDLQTYRTDTQRLDNTAEDRDARFDRVDLGQQRSMLVPDGVALCDLASDGTPRMLVWLKGKHQDGHFVMDQQGYDRDRQGCYAYPLHLEGPGDTPFDPPEAERISRQQFEEAVQRYESEWQLTSATGFRSDGL